MQKLENKEQITKIEMFPIAHCLCVIGKDWYTINFTVTFEPLESYPDYMFVKDYITKEIEGKELNIEQAVNILYEYLKRYNPLKLTVSADVKDASSHFPVKVTK